jgi:hypothetical protein
MEKSYRTNFLRALAILVVMAVVTGSIVYLIYDHQKTMSFRGTIIGRSYNVLSRGRSFYALNIQGDDGQTYKWPISSSDKEYYQIGDYLVKLPGRMKVAVFRGTKQLRGQPCFLDEPVERPVLAAVQAVPTPVATPSESPREKEAQRLLEDATRQWQAKDYEGAIRSSEKALQIRRILYGDEHPLVLEVQNQIEAARSQMEQ